MRNGWQSLTRSAGLAAGVLFAALLLASAVVRLPPIQRWVAGQISARLPKGVTVARALITVVPPGVRLTQVSLGEDGPTLDSVVCRLRAKSLLVGRMEVGIISVDGADATIERAADGSWHVAGPLSAVFTRAPTTDGESAPPGSFLTGLPVLKIKDGTVTLIDHAARGGARTLQFRSVRLRIGHRKADTVAVTLIARLDPAGGINAQGALRLLPSTVTRSADSAVRATLNATALDAQTVLGYIAAVVPGGGTAKAQGQLSAAVTLSGSLLKGIEGTATLSQATGSLVWDEARVTMPLKVAAQFAASQDGLSLSSGQLSIAQVAVNRIAATDLDAAFEYADPILHLTSAHARLYGGTWTQSGTVTLADPPSYEATVSIDNVDCADLLTAVTGARPQYGCAQFNADAAVHGEWTGAKRVAHAAEGSGHVEMRGGTIPAATVIGAVSQAVVPLMHVDRHPTALGAPTLVNHLNQSFTLRAGRMETNDLSLVTDDYTVTGTGTIGLNGTLDLETHVALTPEGVTKLLTMAALPIPGSGGTLPPIPTRITGSVSNPLLHPEMSHVPAAAVQGLLAGARGAGERLKDATDSGLRSLEHKVDQVW